MISWQQPIDTTEHPPVVEQHEDGSVTFIIDAGEANSAGCCDMSTCTILHSLYVDDEYLRMEISDLRQRLREEKSRRKREHKKRRKTERRVAAKLDQLTMSLRRESRLEHRLQEALERSVRLARRNVELADERERLVRAVLSRSIGFAIDTPPAEMDHVMDALTWWCVQSGEDVDEQVERWEMWGLHDSISDEVQTIVREYDAHQRGIGEDVHDVSQGCCSCS